LGEDKAENSDKRPRRTVGWPPLSRDSIKHSVESKKTLDNLKKVCYNKYVR